MFSLRHLFAYHRPLPSRPRRPRRRRPIAAELAVDASLSAGGAAARSRDALALRARQSRTRAATSQSRQASLRIVSLLGRDCITIDRPFHVAFVGGAADNLYNVVEDSCFDLPSSVGEVLNYYPSLYGVMFSASLKGSPGIRPRTGGWHPLDAELLDPIKAGHQFV